MILIKRNESNENTIFIGKPFINNIGEYEYVINIVNKGTNQKYTKTGTLTVVGDYYKLKLDYSDLKDGEYEYELIVNEYSTYGLLRINDYKSNQIKFDLDLKYIEAEL